MVDKLHWCHDILFYHKPGVVFKSGSFVWSLSRRASFKIGRFKPAEKVAELKLLFEKYADKEFYLNPDIDRKELASYLNIQPHIFSSFISQAYQANFNDVINRHRIRYVEEGLKKEKWNELTQEAIAEKAGFNNRVTFLTAFKKFTGTTPTQYIKNIQLQKTSAVQWEGGKQICIVMKIYTRPWSFRNVSK